MFDQSFVDGAGKTNKSWSVTISFIAEFTAVGFMMVVPLIWTEVLPKWQSVNSLLSSVPPPPVAEPRPIPAERQVARTTPRPFDRRMIEAQQVIPRQLTITEDAEAPAISPASNNDTLGGAQDRFPSGAFGTSSFAIGNVKPPPYQQEKAEAKPQPPQAPVTVGGQVQAAKLIKHPAPVYPALAKSARIQGTVVLQAIIGKDGTVQNLRVVSSASPLLVQSAIDAVKQWVYQPTLLNAMPVEVITEITVNFALR